MKIKNKMGVKIFGLVVLSLLLAVNCAEKGTEPDINIPPDTFVDAFKIELAPDSATAYNTTIYWRGSDLDGAIYWYYWQIISDTGDSLYLYEIVKNEEGDSIGVDTTNISTWQVTADFLVTVRLDFPAFDKSYIFEVKAQDNDRDEDATPALETIAIDRYRDFNYAPDTEIISPHNGAITCQGIHFIVQGIDMDGAVDSMDYMVDTDTAWTRVATDITTSILTVDILDIPLGYRTIYFRAIDNFRKTDPSPTSVSVIVVDSLRPDLTVTSGPIPNAYYFLPAGGTTLDLAASWSGNAAWYYSTLTYRYAVDDTSSWSDWQEASSATLEGISAGLHDFYVQAKDLAENITPYATEFGIGELVADRGILLVNGIHFGSYGDEAWDFYNADVPCGDREYDFWDAFSGQDYSNTPQLEARLIGTGVLPGDTLAFYSSMVMIMNGFQGDLEVFQTMLPLIMSYLNAGGNVLLACRYGSRFVYDDLRSYAHVSFSESRGAQIEVSISGLTSQVSGLVDQPGAGISYTDLPVILTHEDVTMIFSVADYPETAGGILVEPQESGNFIFIAGRPYRYDLTASAANYDYMLTEYLGEN